MLTGLTSTISMRTLIGTPWWLSLLACWVYVARISHHKLVGTICYLGSVVYRTPDRSRLCRLFPTGQGWPQAGWVLYAEGEHSQAWYDNPLEREDAFMPSFEIWTSEEGMTPNNWTIVGASLACGALAEQEEDIVVNGIAPSQGLHITTGKGCLIRGRWCGIQC